MRACLNLAKKQVLKKWVLFIEPSCNRLDQRGLFKRCKFQVIYKMGLSRHEMAKLERALELYNILVWRTRVSQNLDFFCHCPFQVFFLAPLLSFFPDLLLSLPFAFHILSDCHKKLGISYRQSLDMGLRYNGPFYHHFCIKTDNVVFEFAVSNKTLFRKISYTMLYMRYYIYTSKLYNRSITLFAFVNKLNTKYSAENID